MGVTVEQFANAKIGNVVKTTKFNILSNYSVGTTLNDNLILFPTPVIKALNNDLIVDLYMPLRNNSYGWGGSRIRLFYSVDGGLNWTLVADSVYNCNTRINGAQAFDHFRNSIKINNIVGTSVLFKIGAASVDGTLEIVQNNVQSGDEFHTTLKAYELAV